MGALTGLGFMYVKLKAMACVTIVS